MHGHIIGFEEVRLEIELQASTLLPKLKLLKKGLVWQWIYLKFVPLCFYQLEYELAFAKVYFLDALKKLVEDLLHRNLAQKIFEVYRVLQRLVNFE